MSEAAVVAELVLDQGRPLAADVRWLVTLVELGPDARRALLVLTDDRQADPAVVRGWSDKADQDVRVVVGDVLTPDEVQSKLFVGPDDVGPDVLEDRGHMCRD